MSLRLYSIDEGWIVEDYENVLQANLELKNYKDYCALYM
jgi:hypothetical protein